MQGISHIYYRGALKSCNYSCDYCPFSKNKASATQLAKDKAALLQFAQAVQTGKIAPKTVMLTPYGEALIHPYYWQVMGELSKMQEIRGIGCQTNLSFAVNQMTEIFDKNGGICRKLRLWCTFHPQMTSVTAFLEQCKKLKQQKIPFCVGAVGNPDTLESIKELYSRLPEGVSMWINKMDGLKRPYTIEEEQTFQAIDPFFSLELKGIPSDLNCCTGGKSSIFAEASGALYACNVSRKKIGNLYSDDVLVHRECSAKSCSCYLAYSNRTDMPELIRYAPDPAFRIPFVQLLPHAASAVFFDIDGTLSHKGQPLSAEVVRLIADLSKQSRIFLATSRPYASAMKLCHPIKPYLSGGVFASGAYIKTGDPHQDRIHPIDDNLANIAALFAKQNHYKIRIYKKENVVYKITLIPNNHKNPVTLQLLQTFLLAHQEKRDHYCIIAEEGYLGIVHKRADKLQGIVEICLRQGIDPNAVLAFGNSAEDAPMLAQWGIEQAIQNRK